MLRGVPGGPYGIKSGQSCLRQTLSDCTISPAPPALLFLWIWYSAIAICSGSRAQACVQVVLRWLFNGWNQTQGLTNAKHVLSLRLHPQCRMTFLLRLLWTIFFRTAFCSCFRAFSYLPRQLVIYIIFLLPWPHFSCCLDGPFVTEVSSNICPQFQNEAKPSWMALGVCCCSAWAPWGEISVKSPGIQFRTIPICDFSNKKASTQSQKDNSETTFMQSTQFYPM